MSLFLGFIAGALHVFAGPDHLAAGLAFRRQGKAGAWYYGGVWALGHAAGLSVVGLLYIMMIESRLLATVSLFAERMVGVSLILVGAWMLLRHHHPWTAEKPMSDASDGLLEGETSVASRRQGGTMAALFGLLHGTAGATHLLGLVPMFALQQTHQVVAYLISYNIGILLAMSSFCAVVGVLQQRAMLRTKNSFWGFRLVASLVCLVVGSYWLVA